MIISYNWLSEYLPVQIPVEKLSTILTSIGLEVEHIEKSESIKGGLEGLIVGEVLTAVQHPNADKLKLTTVNVGSGEALKIVCGAPNVAAGQKVVVATVGTTVHPTAGEAFKIKKAKIRGEESEGMLCAEDEIGLSENHAGIMVLPADAPVGTPVKEYLGLGGSDYSIHIGLTPNRSDAASHLGVARDVCAWMAHHEGGAIAVKMPQLADISAPESKLQIGVDIADPTLCPRYMGVCLEGLKITASPDWLKARLQAIGIRSINNAVDVTNYVLHTWGQPLHAFDYDKITGHHIIVKTLPAGTHFTTLDGKDRTLTDADLMICDEAGGLCIAGVFGGAESGITDGTSRIFLESAVFNARSIRRTSLHHGLRTDAATHFEKGVDIENARPALLHAVQLLQEICGATVASKIIDLAAETPGPKGILLTWDYLQRLSGKAYEAGQVKAMLLSLGFKIDAETEAGIELLTPVYKHDISGPADIVEEFLRIDGLDKVEIPQRLNISLLATAKTDRALQNKIADLLCGEGFSEIITNSITNSAYYKDVPTLVRMKNSLSALLDCLRPRMLESGLEVMAYNVSRRQQDLLLFDFGNVYEETAPQQYRQAKKLMLYATGSRIGKSHTGSVQPADAFFLKSAVNNIATKCGIANGRWTSDAEGVTLAAGNKMLARISKAPDAVLQTFDIRQPVYYADIDWDALDKLAAKSSILYTEISKHPVVQRDLAVVVDKSVRYEQLATATDLLKLAPLQSFELFDVFESDKLGKDKKSLALSFNFNLPDRTLTDAETDAMMQQIRKSFETGLAAQIRE